MAIAPVTLPERPFVSYLVRSYTERAYGKLNLDLAITGRDDSGLHTINSRFVLVDCYDKVALYPQPHPGNAIMRAWAHDAISDEEDLAMRAARRFAEVVRPPCGVSVMVDKRIPLGSGMGGGSSDAAEVLRGLNYLWAADLSTKQLIEIGKPLGSDIAFFLSRAACAQVSGTGDTVQPKRSPQHYYLLVHPPLHISTAAVYQRYRQQQDDGAAPVPTVLDPSNALSSAAIATAPDLLPYAKALHNACGQAHLSGSGSTLFAIFQQQADATAAQKQLPPHYKTAVVTTPKKM